VDFVGIDTYICVSIIVVFLRTGSKIISETLSVLVNSVSTNRLFVRAGQADDYL
jgi:hypothetical protein